MVLDLHALDAGKHPCNGVVIDDFQHELDVGKHDVGGAGREKIQALPVFLSCLDPALGVLAAQPVRVDDEAAAMNARKCGEADLLCPALSHEHLFAFIGVGRPGAGKFGSSYAFRHSEGRDHSHPHHALAKICHSHSPRDRIHQWPLSTSVWIGSSNAWIRNSMACTRPTASIACRTKPWNAPVSLDAMTS